MRLSVIKKILCFCLLISFVTSFVACKSKKSDEEMILDRIDEFLFCYNNGDFDGLLECLSTKQRNKIEGQVKLLESIGLGYEKGGFSVSGSIDYGSLFGMAAGTISDGELLSVELLELEITDSKNAVAYTSMKFSSTLTKDESLTKFIMVKEKNGWYIADMQDFELPIYK